MTATLVCPALASCRAPVTNTLGWQLLLLALYVSPSLPDYAQRSWRAALHPALAQLPRPLSTPASLAPAGSTSNAFKQTGRPDRRHGHCATRSPRPRCPRPALNPGVNSSHCSFLHV